MKILHVCETAVGGVASYLNMVCQLGDDIQDVVLAPQDHISELDPSVDARAYPAKGRGPRSMWAMIGATRRLIRDERPQIVFLHSTFALLAFAAIWGTRPRPATIYCAHGWSSDRYAPGSWKHRVVSQIEGRLCGLADRVVTISATDQAQARAAGYRGTHVLIENAVMDRASTARHDLLAEQEEQVNLLFVGRFDRQKGLDILLPAFARARAQRPDLRLYVIGSAVRGDVTIDAMPDGATALGWVDKSTIDDWYGSVDALIVPSRWEGFGLVVPEALRNGTPTLVARRGALPSLVEPGVTGAVFDLTQEAVTACLVALEKSDLRAKRPAARAHFETRFGFARFAKQMRLLYTDLAGRDLPPPADSPPAQVAHDQKS